MKNKTKISGLVFAAVLVAAGFVYIGISYGHLLENQKEMTQNEENKSAKVKLPEIEKPRIIVKKSERKLELLDGEKLVKTYKTVLGFAPVGDKEKEGDGKTPEGEFYIFTKNDQSKFYLSLGISYPAVEDAKRGLKTGLISQSEHDEIIKAFNEKKMPLQKTKLGGEIYIHGGGIEKDWTWGCAAMQNDDIKELFETVEVGTPVTILP